MDETVISPMTYAEALRTLRSLIQCPCRSETPDGIVGINFTMHSMKSTFLAWAIQVDGISEDMRLVQGHHRGKTNLKIYSRDDVFLQLKLQRILLDAIQKGFRPSIAQHRGSQSPLVEPPVDLESFSKSWQLPTWKMFNFTQEQQPKTSTDPLQDLELDVSDDDSDSSKASSTDSSSSAESRMSQMWQS